MMNLHSLPKLIWLLIVVISFSFCLNAQKPQPQPAVYNQKLQTSSLLFMENKGQIADVKGNLRPDILFTANNAGAKLYLSANAIHYQFTKMEYPKGYDPHRKEPIKDFEKEAELQKQIKTSTHRFSLELQGANLYPTVTTEKQSAYTENYYLAQCPDGITGVHGYEKIIYKNVYPKIDWIIYSKGGFMEYDFLIHPGGNPASIKLKVEDAESVAINAAGELVMKTSLGEVREKAPVSYADGAVVETHFKQLANGTIGFDVQPQPGKELRIDPSVVWATYYGGNLSERSRACAVDSLGNVYLTGLTTSKSNIAFGGFQDTTDGAYIQDAFLVKFNAAGTRLWGTYYGGRGSEEPYACCVDRLNNVYIAGTTNSPSNIAFGGFQDSIGNPYYDEDAFLVKFSTDGNRLWGTYYGGTSYETGYSCATDSSNNVYLAGNTSSQLGIASNGFQNVPSANGDAFLVKFNATGVRLWATYYGGEKYDIGTHCITDHSGNIYLTGRTESSSGIASGGFQNTYGGGYDCFLVKFNSIGNRIWATYYGGAADDDYPECAIDNMNNVYISGMTKSSSGIAMNGFQNQANGNDNAFLVKFNSNGNRVWGTYYGDSNGSNSNSCTVDSNGNVYIAGTAFNKSSPHTMSSGGFQNDYGGGNYDGYIAKFNSNGNRLWSTYYGGNQYDWLWSIVAGTSGNVYVAGETWSTTGISNGGFQNNFGGGQYYGDGYLAKIDGDKTLKTLCPNVSDSIISNFTGPSYQWQIDTGSGFINITDTVYYSGITNKTLRLKNLPSSFYGYQYRAFVNGNYTEPFQLKFANRWIGTTNSAWENPANWSCGIVPDGNTDVIINTGPVTLNSNGICRTLTVRPGVNFTVASGYTLTITH